MFNCIVSDIYQYLETFNFEMLNWNAWNRTDCLTVKKKEQTNCVLILNWTDWNRTIFPFNCV